MSDQNDVVAAPVEEVAPETQPEAAVEVEEDAPAVPVAPETPGDDAVAVDSLTPETEAAPEAPAAGTVVKEFSLNGIAYKRIAQEGGSTLDVRA
jgi:hypothetical protein